MNIELKLQALVDGELDVHGVREVEALLARDEFASSLVQELKWTKSAVRDGEAGVALPESREFFWSKIERGIAAEARNQAAPAAPVAPAWWTRLLFPASGLAAMLAVMFVLSGPRSGTDDALNENVAEDINAYSFHSEAEKMSVVYVSDENVDFSPVGQEVKNETEAEK
jgi:anti-sigma factor RsiW